MPSPWPAFPAASQSILRDRNVPTPQKQVECAQKQTECGHWVLSLRSELSASIPDGCIRKAHAQKDSRPCSFYRKSKPQVLSFSRAPEAKQANAKAFGYKFSRFLPNIHLRF